MAKAKKQVDAAISIEPDLLISHLERVLLGGLIGECVLVCESGHIFTTAVDLSNSVFLSVKTPLNLDSLGTIGLGNLGIITKFLESAQDSVEIVSEQHKLLIKANGGPSLRYLLAMADLIPTYDPGHAGAIDTLMEQSPFEAPLPAAAVDGYLQMMGLLKPKSGMLTVSPGSEMTITGGLETEHQFMVNLGPAPEKLNKAFDLHFFAENLRSVLATVKDKELIFRFGEDKPLLVSVVGEEAHWAFLPVKE
jgi:hypothetical protein